MSTTSTAVTLAPRIIADPGIRSGRPVIEGTRVPVDLVLAKLAGGMAPDDLAHEYDLAPDDVRAALAYAAAILGTEEIRATGTTGTTGSAVGAAAS